MAYARLAERLYNTPLLLTPEKAEAIEHVFRMHAEGKAAELPQFETPEKIDLAAQMSVRRADGGYYVTTSGIALVRVHGSLVQRSGGLDAMSGLTGYNALAAQLSAAARSSEVRGIVLEIDSPGGEVAGLAEFADFVASIDKPVWAHANELAASAAYWVATAADKIMAAKTALVGSIGVVMLHVDRSVANAKAGVTYTPIFAGARKVDAASFAPLSDEARAIAQARVDEIYSLFVKQVAAHRGMTEAAVRQTEAGVFSAPDAMKRKLLDGVATLGDTVQAMTDELNAGRMITRKPNYGRAAVTPAQSQQEKTTMEHEDGKPAAQNQPAAAPQVDTAAIAEKAKAEGQKAGVEAERARVKGIMQHPEAAGRTKLAEHLAYNTTSTVEEAGALLAVAAKEVSGENPLAAAMPPNPKIGADTPDTGAAAGVAISSSAIFANREKQRLAVVNGSK